MTIPATECDERVIVARAAGPLSDEELVVLQRLQDRHQVEVDELGELQALVLYEPDSVTPEMRERYQYLMMRHADTSLSVQIALLRFDRRLVAKDCRRCHVGEREQVEND